MQGHWQAFVVLGNLGPTPRHAPPTCHSHKGFRTAFECLIVLQHVLTDALHEIRFGNITCCCDIRVYICALLTTRETQIISDGMAAVAQLVRARNATCIAELCQQHIPANQQRLSANKRLQKEMEASICFSTQSVHSTGWHREHGVRTLWQGFSGRLV